MTSLATPDAPLVWEAISAALTGRAQSPTEAARRAVRRSRAALDARARLACSTRRTRPSPGRSPRPATSSPRRSRRSPAGSPAAAGGSSTSAREPPAGSPRSTRPSAARPSARRPARSSRSCRRGEDAEDDRERGAADLAPSGSAADDAVVAVSASGCDAVHARRPREPRADAGALRVAVVCARGSALGALAEHEVAVVVGPGGDRRVDASQGGHRAEARAQRDLDRDDGSSRPHVCRPDGRRRARTTRSCASVRAATSCSPAARPEDDVDAALDAAGGDARVALVSLLAGVDPSTARERLDGAGGSVRLALGRHVDEARRRSGARRGELVPGDVEVDDGLVVAVGLGGGVARPRRASRASSTSR